VAATLQKIDLARSKMAKKIYDIMPPKLEEKIEDAVKILTGQTGKKRHYKKSSAKSKTNFKFSLKHVLATTGILAFILLGFLYFKLQSVKVEIWPKTEVLAFKQKITANKSVEVVDSEKNVIPAKIFEEQQDLWQNFPATGVSKEGAKASAVIKVYNKYSPSSALTLKTGTHFLSDSGKYFVTLQKITIPGAKMVSGKFVPGSIDVKVEAEEPGEDYNLSSAKFSVPKLVGTPYYYNIYAELQGPASGGFSKDIKQVTAEDIQEAKETLSKKLLDSAEVSLRQKISQDYVVLNNAISKNIVESSSAVKAGALVNDFNYQAKAKLTAVVFKKSDIEKFAKDYIAKNMQDKKVLVEKSFAVNYGADLVDFASGKIIISSDFSEKIYDQIDTADLLLSFRDKNEREIRDFVKNNFQDKISNVNVKFWPFWASRAPANKNKIKVDLKFEL
jgi:hypothetical protein